MRHWRSLTAAFVLAGCIVSAAGQSQVAATPTSNQTRVLTLYAMGQKAPFYAIGERVFQRILGDALGPRLDYYSELLDTHRFRDPSYASEFEDYIVRKYRDRTIDLLLAGPNEAALAVRLQARLASQPPIVFAGLDERPVPKSTGLNHRNAMKESLDLALRVQPDTRKVYVVAGASPVDKSYEDEFRSQVPVPPPGVELIYLTGLPMRALTDRLATLPAHSVIFLVLVSADIDGRLLEMPVITEQLAASSNAPIYTWNANYRGAFGGRLLSSEAVVEKTAEIALRVLRGERPEDIPVTRSVVSFDALDWRQLGRWHVSEARVPAGVELRFRESSVFERYRGYILSAAALFVLQTVLIVGLVVQRVRRRRVEAALRESEGRFRLMADTAPVLVWRSDTDQQHDFFNQPWLDFRGRTAEQEVGSGWTEGVHPSDLAQCLATYQGAFDRRELFRMEYRLKRRDGEYRWVLDTGVPRFGSDGRFGGYIGSCIDITERRQAEEALRANEAALRQSHGQVQDLAGRLITAQEMERARIARDLHDDIGQQLAAISIAISGCKRRPDTQGSAELVEALTAVQRRIIGLAEDIRLLSHDLHPGALTHAGLVEAVRSHCAEFARQQAIDVAVDADDEIEIADIATALCLYRIVQEALRNIAKHADARRVLIVVRRVEDEVQLTVGDDGKGFILKEAREQGGLGLRSMDERVRLVGGRLSIEAMPGRGTTITVWVKTLVTARYEPASV